MICGQDATKDVAGLECGFSNLLHSWKAFWYVARDLGPLWGYPLVLEVCKLVVGVHQPDETRRGLQTCQILLLQHDCIALWESGLASSFIGTQ